MLRQGPIFYLVAVVSLTFYCWLGYSIQRFESVWLLSTYSVLFALYIWMLQRSTAKSLDFFIYASISFRLILLFSIPSLSDDFYRFVWDGRLLANGFHPFLALPGYYLEAGHAVSGIDQFLFDHLNSQEYFTVYPPLAQIIFWISAVVFPNSIMGSVVTIRIFILLAEIGSIYFIKKLLLEFKLDVNHVLIYALNPLVILELTGNLHFEAIVIFFLLLLLYWLVRSRIWQAGIALGLAIAAKLLPLIFLPLFLVRIGIRKALILYSAVLVTIILFFIPFFYKGTFGFGNSLGLYFNSFEFNASIYYLVREYGYLIDGYNIIQTVGWKLGVIAMILIFIISFSPYRLLHKGGRLHLERNHFTFPEVVFNIPQVMLWVSLAYFLMATTLHPWYITTLLMISVFTPYRFVLLWTLLIFFTYLGYEVDGFAENLWLITLEYVMVIGYLVYELIWKRKYIYS